MANPHPNMSGLTPFTSTYQPKKKGRKPAKWKKYCKEFDLSDTDRKFVAQVLLSKKTIGEIKDLVQQDDLPFGIWAACVAMIADARKGGTGFLTYIFDAAFGKLKEHIEHSGNMSVDLIDPEARKKRIDELIAEREGKNDQEK